MGVDGGKHPNAASDNTRLLFGSDNVLIDANCFDQLAFAGNSNPSDKCDAANHLLEKLVHFTLLACQPGK